MEQTESNYTVKLNQELKLNLNIETHRYAV